LNYAAEQSSQYKDQFEKPIGFPVPGWKPAPLPKREIMHGVSCRVEPIDPVRHGRSLFEASALDSHGKNWTYFPYGPCFSWETYEQWMNQVCLGDDPLFFAIVDNATNRAIGVASYLRIDPTNGVIEVGHINYSPLLQRTKLATEAMYLMMKNVFHLGYRRYEWKCDSLNAPSRASAQRLGFSYEGIFRQAMVYKGRNRDTAWYSVLDWEWPDLEGALFRWLSEDNFDAEGRQRTKLGDLTGTLLKQRG
jgi:RimJ/RimL family protein N-acetyltransferase